VLRLPEEPAQALREALRSGASNVRERLNVQLETEAGKGGSSSYVRVGHVHFDGWQMSAKMVDLPTIVESTKTIDGKTFYKTADISQMLICKEGDFDDDEDEEEREEAASKKAKKNDPNKVDKKYIWKHGLCPPLKNCRRRRFRKTLRKKFVEAPEIEKEVKRLLRLDNESVKPVRWEIVTEAELQAKPQAGAGVGGSATPAAAHPEESSSAAVDERELFGDALSDTDDEEEGGGKETRLDVESEGDSTAFEGPASSAPGTAEASMSSALPSTSTSSNPPVTQFNPSMFPPPASATTTAAGSSSSSTSQHLAKLQSEIASLRTRKEELQANVANCDNPALRQRFQLSLAEVEMEMGQKEEEVENLSMLGM